MTVTVPTVAAAPVIPAGTFLGSQNSGTFIDSTDNLTLAAGANNTVDLSSVSHGISGAEVVVTTDPTTGQTRFLQLVIPLGDGSTFNDTFDLTTAIKGNNQFVAVANNGGNTAIVLDPTLNFSTYGVWVSVGTTTASTGGFAAGTMTPAAAIPTVGTATYTGGVLGSAVNKANNNALSALQGTFTLNANFGAMTVSGNFNINDLTTGVTFGNLTMASTSIGTTAGGPFSGTLTGNLEDGNPTTASDVNGHFYGPTANETAGTFSAANNNWQAVGAFGGKKQ